eukprot:scaffold1611_cov334-Prasinococcus_capsulatus_cf.AAC.1
MGSLPQLLCLLHVPLSMPRQWPQGRRVSARWLSPSMGQRCWQAETASGVGYTATLRLECRIQPPVVVTGAFRAQQRLAVPCHVGIRAPQLLAEALAFTFHELQLLLEVCHDQDSGFRLLAEPEQVLVPFLNLLTQALVLHLELLEIDQMEPLGQFLRSLELHLQLTHLITELDILREDGVTLEALKGRAQLCSLVLLFCQSPGARMHSSVVVSPSVLQRLSGVTPLGQRMLVASAPTIREGRCLLKLVLLPRGSYVRKEL